MPKHYDLNLQDILPPPVLDGLMEFVAPLAANFRLQGVPATSGNTIRGVAGAGAAQASIGVNGLWRWRTANHDVSAAGSPSTGAGTKEVWVVASANELGAGDADTTDYNWYIAVTPTGVSPTGNTPAGKAITAFRKVGQFDWDGSKIVNDLIIPATEREIESAFRSPLVIANRFTPVGDWTNAHPNTFIMTSEPRADLITATPSLSSLIWIDPVDYPGPRAATLRLRLHLETNITAPGVDVGAGIRAVTINYGSSGNPNSYSVGALLGSQAVWTTPAASQQLVNNAAVEVAVPATAGYYVIQGYRSGAPAAGSYVRLRAHLQVVRRYT